MKGPLDTTTQAQEIAAVLGGPEVISVGKAETPVGSLDDMDRYAIGRAVGLNNFDEIKKYQDQIKRLHEWARMKGAKDREDSVWQIKQLANRIGGPTIGNNWAQHLSTYAHLEMERMGLDTQLRSMEGQHGSR